MAKRAVCVRGQFQIFSYKGSFSLPSLLHPLKSINPKELNVKTLSFDGAYTRSNYLRRSILDGSVCVFYQRCLTVFSNNSYVLVHGNLDAS